MGNEQKARSRRNPLASHKIHAGRISITETKNPEILKGKSQTKEIGSVHVFWLLSKHVPNANSLFDLNEQK